MLLSKKAAKTSAKTVAKSAATLKTSIEFAVQPLMEDTLMKEKLEKMGQNFLGLEKSLADKAKLDPTELAKNFAKAEDELEKIIKKIKGFQEYILLAENSLHEKLLSKIQNLKEAKKNAKAQEEYKKQAERLIGEIRILLDNAKKKVNELADKAESVIKQHKLLKPKLAVFSLPENLTQSDKQTKKLKERLELLCQASFELDLPSLVSLGIDKDKMMGFLPQLQANVKSCGQLVDQALLNLKPLMLSNGAIVQTSAIAKIVSPINNASAAGTVVALNAGTTAINSNATAANHSNFSMNGSYVHANGAGAGAGSGGNTGVNINGTVISHGLAANGIGANGVGIITLANDAKNDRLLK